MPVKRTRKQESIPRLGRAVLQSLTPDLVQAQFRHLQKKSSLGGHCYVVTEAMYHLLGGRTGEYMPARIDHEGSRHYYLKHRKTGKTLDLTANQFETPPPYERGRGCAYRRPKPSKRAAIVIERASRLLRRPSRSSGRGCRNAA